MFVESCGLPREGGNNGPHTWTHHMRERRPEGVTLWEGFDGENSW